MKKRILALSLAVATVITVLAVGIFASTILRSSDAVLTAADTGPVIVAGYATEGDITISSYAISASLGSGENWVLPGRLVDSNGNVYGTFGAQWNEDYLYIAIQRSNASDSVSLNLNGVACTVTTSSYNTITEQKIAMSNIGLGDIDSYNAEVPITISLSSGGSFSGTLKLSSVEWWKTSNVSNSITASLSTPTGMREYDITEAENRGDIGRENITNGLHLWDKYNTTEGITNYMGGRTQATYWSTGYENMANRDQTVYFSFDFNAVAMPEYELAEALGSYHSSPYYANFGFTWQMADAPVDIDGNAGTQTCSNVSMGGIVNTADGLYLVIAGRHFNTLKLNKEVGDTFNVGLAWHSNGDLSVYIDGVEKAYYTGTTKYMLNGSHVISQGVRLMCRRNELPREVGDDFDLYITNLAFGSAQPDAPVKALSFKNIQGTNTSTEAVTSNLVLPTDVQDIYGDALFSGNISWTSSNESVISTTGEVNQPTTTGAEKVTLTAKDDAGNQKTIDVIVLGTDYSSQNVLVVEGDKSPSVGAATEYTGGVFHFDSNNNSLVYNLGTPSTVNVIKLRDLDEVSRLNRETISIWTSNNNVTYTRVEDNYKLLHVGQDWYLYNFEATAQYIKVNFTLSDELYATDMDSLDDVQMVSTYTMYDTVESDFTNVVSDIMLVYYEEVFGANTGEFSETSVTIKNNSGKKQQDYAWCVSGSNLGVDLTNVRVMLDGEYLYHYVDGDNLYVRIPDVEKDASVTLTVLYGNAQAWDISDKESVHEVTYGTKEMFIDENQRFMFALEAGTALRNGTTLQQDVIIRNYVYYFDLSNDGGQTWRKSGTFSTLTYDGYSANGGYIFYEGRLYWRTQARVNTPDGSGNTVATYPAVVVTYSDDGGETWATPQVIDHPVINETTITVSSYANGIATSIADGAGPNIDLIYPLSGYLEDGNAANVFLMSDDGGETWKYGDSYLFKMTEQRSEGGLTEATLLENEAHELVWYCRYQTNASYHFAIAVSKDYGLTWSEPVESTVYGTNTQPTITPIDGDPLFVWGGNNNFGGNSFNRGPLSVAVSYDGLYTFRNIQNVFTETYFEDYTQTKFCAYITNPSVVKSGEDLIIAYYTNQPKYKVFTRITDYENWFYRTKGIYDSFESQNTKYEGWVTFMGGTAISTNASAGNYSLEIQPHGVVSRSVPYLQNGTVSMNVYADGQSTFTIQLQSAFTPVMNNKCAPVSLTVKGTELWANNANTYLSLEEGWNTITVNLGLAKNVPTASVSVSGGNAVDFAPNVEVENVGIDGVGYNDYVCYIVVNTGEESICVDEVLVQSNLDAINYNGEIREVELEIVTQPSSQEVLIDESATFRVVAQGYGLMYQWYVSEDGGATWNAIDGATSAIYTTDPLTIGEGGNETWQYKCIVMDRNENAEESAVVTRSVYGIYISIEWGSMDFLCYKDHVWKPVSDGDDQITIKNECTNEMQASVTYAADEGFEGVMGSFEDDETPETASATLAPAERFGVPVADGIVTWTLKLSGDAIPDLTEPTPIGGVTIRIVHND